MAIGILINPRTFEPRVAYQHKTGVYFTSLGGTKEAGDGSLELEDYMPQTPEEQASGYARSHVNRVREKNNGDGTVMYTALGLATERIVAGEVRETRVPARAGVCSVPRGGGLEDTPRWHQAEAWWDNARTKYGLAHRIVVPDPRFRGEGLVEVDVYPFERALAANLVGCIFGGVEVSLSGPPFNPSDVVSVNPNVLLAMDTDLEALGTNAHELPMVFAALTKSDGELKESPYRVLQDWQRYYGGNLLIVLPDAFGTDAFLHNAPDWVADWTGFRPDSAPPIEAGERIIAWWKKRGVDPEQKLLIF